METAHIRTWPQGGCLVCGEADDVAAMPMDYSGRAEEEEGRPRGLIQLLRVSD